MTTITHKQKNLPFNEVIRLSPHPISWEDMCRLTQFEGSWATEQENNERRILLSQKTPRKEIKKPQPTIDESQQWKIVEKKKPLRLVRKTDSQFNCPKCGMVKNKFQPMCKKCFIGKQTCPICGQNKHPSLSQCTACNY